MIADLEMNGTIRGAVEEFNLCISLRLNDALFAECVRTFAAVRANAQQWLRRLEVKLGQVGQMQVAVFVPPTRKPNVRSIRSKAPFVDICGVKPHCVYGSAIALSVPSHPFGSRALEHLADAVKGSCVRV